MSSSLYRTSSIFYYCIMCVVFTKGKIMTNDPQRKYTKNKIPVLGGGESATQMLISHVLN